MPGRWISLLLVAMLLSGILMACGGDDDGDGNAEAGAGATATLLPAMAAPSPTAAAPDIPSPTPTASQPSAGELVIPPEIPEGVPQEGRTLGDPDAPVAVVEYGDFM